MKIFVLILCLLALTFSQQDKVSSQIIVGQSAEVVMEVGQIAPGKIDLQQSKQQMHYIRVSNLAKKYLFIRLTTFDKVRHSMGIYSNQTRDLIHACQDSIYDQCYVPTSKFENDKVYVVLIVAMDNMQYNIYTYFGDLEHLQPNRTIKFTFNKEDLTQLFHLQLKDANFNQIRIIMKPEAARVPGDAVKMYANLGLKEEPTVQKHDFESSHIWGDAQAIILNKDQVKDQQAIGLYIVGDVQTVYTLHCQFVTQQKHEIKVNQTINQYLPKNKQAVYKINFKEAQGVDTFTLKFSAFTGEVSVDFFYDKEMKKVFNKIPFQYMNDIQFYFSKSDFEQQQKELYMRVKSFDHQSTYQAIFSGRVKQVAYEITENVYQFAVTKTSKQAMYFYAHIWHLADYQQSVVYKYDVSVIKIFGDPTFDFYLCLQNSNQYDCKNVNSPNFDKSVQKITPLGTEKIGQKTITTLQIKSQKFKQINNVEKRLLVIIKINTPQKQKAAIAVQYSNPNNIRLLREGRAFQDKVRGLQRKYYKYVNNNPLISQIRIHINQLNGLTKVKAKRGKIQQPGGQQIFLSKKVPNTIVIKDRVTEPVYVEVLGLVSSLYTISVSAIHPEHKITNALVMAQDIEYQVKLEPYKTLYLQLHPIQEAIEFEYYVEGGVVTLCQVNTKNVCNDQIESSSHGILYIDSSQSREVRVMIKNQRKADFDTQLEDDNTDDQNFDQQKVKKKSPIKSISRNVKLTLLYHAAGIQHCEQKRLNKVYSQAVKPGQCLKFHLPLATDLQIMFAKSEIGIAAQQYYLCSVKVNPQNVNDRYIIKAESIKKLCQKSQDGMFFEIIVNSKNPKVVADLKIQYAVQYNNDTLTLADGVAYKTKGFSNSQNAIRTFFYQIIDETRDLNILLHNYRGFQKFYADITTTPDRYFKNVTEARAKFSSSKSIYYTNPYLKITPSDIKQAKCGKTCVLIISVYSSERMGEQIDYSLQVTQNHIELRQDEVKSDFLSKGSFRYYQYQSRRPRGSIFFKVSDNNRGCAKAMMSYQPFPSESNNNLKQYGGVIFFDVQQKRIYYFAVQAIQDCPYTVMCSQREGLVTKLQYGQTFDLQLQQGVEKWFFTRHIFKSPLKIMFIKKHGQIQLFANETDLSRQTLKSIQDNKISKNQFNFKSSYKNTLVINPEAKGFCQKCYYLVCVQATSLTEGALFLGSENTRIQIAQNKIFYDQLETEDSSTYGNLYTIRNGVLEMKVHSGKIKFQMKHGSQKFSKEYAQDKNVYRQEYNFSLNQAGPIEVKVTAIQIPALYSFQLKTQVPQQVQGYRNIITGDHMYAYLQGGRKQCFMGKLTHFEQQLYLSTDSQNELGLQNLKINMTLDGKQYTEYEKQLVGNIMSIKFKTKQRFFNVVKQYRFCVVAQGGNKGSLSLFQHQKVDLINSDTQVMIKNQSKFVIYPRSDIIVDIFECKGTAKIFYGPDLQKIRTKQQHKLDTLGIPGQSHAVKLNAQGTFYINIESNLSTMIWMPFIQKEERGVGYYKYAIGDLQYRSRFNSIQFVIGGVYRVAQTKTQVQSIRYSLLVSNNKQLLKEAVMCQKYAVSKLEQVSLKTTTVGSGPSYEFSMFLEKKKITQKFSQNQTLYFNVVAEMVLRLPNNSTIKQHYKFIYYQQMVPSDVFRQNKVQSMQITLLIVFAVVSVIGFIIIACIFIKCIVPAIGRLKNRVLVEQKDDKDQSIPVPQSSDRNQIPGVGSSAQDEKIN